MSRKIYQIAADISADWHKPNYGAAPYLAAMQELDDINGRYYEDSAKSVVLYFLANASTWRGENAKRLKAELKALAGVK